MSVKLGKKLSIAFVNHCITVLNNFLHWSFLKNHAAPSPKCPRFPDHLEGSRGIEDVIDPQEFELIKDFIKRRKDGKIYSDLYHILYHTGLRLNECLGLSIGDFMKAPIPHKGPLKQLKLHKKQPMARSQLTRNWP
jgi:integrase